MAESANLPALLERLQAQTVKEVSVYCCVNNDEGSPLQADNEKCLQLLEQVDGLSVTVIDRCSPGQGWTGKKRGVGWARKLLFDRIAAERDADELIVSLDADTDFDTDYLEAVFATLNARQDCCAFWVPYFHPLEADEAVCRALLRYECYMRRYLIQLLRIGNPYAFTALGSAMVFPVWAYRRVGGITPLQGGEDFYLMQKFAKTGLLTASFIPPYDSSSMVVRPQGRPSSRVPFGTGPAIVKGVEAMQESYPFYADEGFAAVKATYDLFNALYEGDSETPMSPFLRRQLATDDLWGPLRKNFKSRPLFIKACAERVDGLRILQYLKNTPAYRLPDSAMEVDFRHDPLETLDAFRRRLFETEMSLRRTTTLYSTVETP